MKNMVGVNKMLYKLTWEQFKETIVDDKGIRIKFENLCRQLFVNEYLSKNKKSRLYILILIIQE